MKHAHFRSDVTVQLLDSMGSDASIVQAMLVSTQGADALQAEESQGRINFLMANRHGTPFEHAAMTLYVQAPIFVFREFHRHRIGWSYNEESGRYKEMDGVFYIPGPERNLVQVGKPGAYTYVPGTPEQYEILRHSMMTDCELLYRSYQSRLAAGVAKEVARMTLPLNLYTSMVTTANPRSIMAFLSLRKTWPEYVAKFPSFPMREIEMVAERIDAIFDELFPLTRAAFVKNGCVSP